jgi:hypothetical protein
MRNVRLINATCPECRGPLSEVTEDGVTDFRCLVEHRYSAMGMLQAHSETQETALWKAVLVLQEAAVIAREAAVKMPDLAESLEGQAQEKLRQSEMVRVVLNQLRPFALE